MIERKQQKAPRNHTLHLSAEDIAAFKPQLITLNDLKSSADIDNTTINADLYKVLDYLPDEFADLIIIDPPYNLTKDYNGLKFKAMHSDDYDTYLESWFSKVCRKLKPTGSLYLCGDFKCSSALQRVMEKELTILNRITRQREKCRGALKNWKNCMEDIWFGVKNPKQYYFNAHNVMMRRQVNAPYKSGGRPKDWEKTKNGNFRNTYPSNFWDDISVPFWSMKENTPHPTQKPEKLYAKLILASSQKGDMVFDPFLGSGTSSVVAQKLGRRYCGVEINQEYALLAQKRLKMAKENPSIQGYENGVFWERNTKPLPID
ncbi:MAG: site-specific DNA-methyltransferase [Alphaproteobacteria bacterium]|nr:site-specific DNA-methyltransferase [Alphaproteobacteria bacterium]